MSLPAICQAAGTINLPRTGQTICYDENGVVITCAGTGQDGEIQAGVAWPSPRFTDNSDGTITDNLTGLMWTKDANLPGASKTPQAALDYVAGMNAGTYQNLGYNDWRLPNVNELESLVNASPGNPVTWLNTQGFTNVQSNYYWSSTTYVGYPGGGWVVYMGGGDVDDSSGSSSYYVWAVRAGQGGTIDLPKSGQTTSFYSGDDGDLQRGVAWPNPRFIDHGDDTVTDNLTGLMWTKNANLPNSAKTWQEALNYVKTVTAGGYTNWRLPNRNELQSIVDYSRYNPAIDTTYFPGTVVSHYWSSTTYVGSSDLAWSVVFDGGVVYAGGKPDGYFVRAVRGGVASSTSTTTSVGGVTSSSTTSTGGTSTTTSTTTSSSSTSSSTTSQPSTTTTSIKHKEKAIIVAGGGPEQPMWGAIKNMAEYAYRTLKFQGISAGNIYYLSAAGDDEWSADYDDKATKDNLQKAIQWADDADELIVYLTDHGGDGTFRMNDEEILEAETELDSWLDSINAGKKIVFIYEACKSGSFLPILKPSSGQQRIVMTSVSANEKAKIDPYGLVSFSQYFWAGVLRGEDVCDAFTGGQDSITFQTALLDANGDGVYDAKVDCGLVDDYIIGMGYGTLDDRPTINSICGEQSLANETTASIWVDNIVSTGKIVMVWGLVDEPEVVGETGDDIVSLPFVTLDQKSEGSTRYEGEYSGFTLQGTYQIAVYAMDESGNISMPTVTRVTRSGASMTTTIPHGVTTTTTTLTIPVTVDFMGSPPKGIAPLAVEFFNLSRGETEGYEWNFGDDSKTSTEENPIHTYTKAGTYDVLLMVTGADGSKKYKIKEDHVEVTEGTGTTTTTTSTTTTITSTTTTIKVCPARIVAGGDNETLGLLRQFRDEVMMTTPAGREYVRLYYKHASEVTSILISNPEIVLQAERALKIIMPEIESVMQGKKEAINDEMLSQINEVLDKTSSKAGSELRHDIEILKNEFLSSRFNYLCVLVVKL